VSAIAHFLESEGIQTTGISLVRENTEALQPPRFLWTSFPLGRPLGKPGDPPFQRRVILAALGLLERDSGPVLEDYPEDLPELAIEDAPACPMSFARPAGAQTGATPSWQNRLAAELALMRPWHALSVRRRGRTTVGIAKAPVDALIGRLAAALEAPLLEGTDLKALKYALEDLKAYYQEALTAQPGHHDFQETARVLWQETELGGAMLALHERFLGHEDRRFKAFARGIAPRSQTRGRGGD
jgi:D-proline reductase (dithiol) PrdB